MRNQKDNTPRSSVPLHHRLISMLRPIMVVSVIAMLLLGAINIAFDRYYEHKIYPAVAIGPMRVGSKTPEAVTQYWIEKNKPLTNKQFIFTFGTEVATVSAADLAIGYDATLSATQAYEAGRSGHIGADLLVKFALRPVNITPYFRWNEQVTTDTFSILAERINIPVQEALFRFASGKVSTFKPSKDGRRVNTAELAKRFRTAAEMAANIPQETITIPIPVEIVKPTITTDQTNTFGVKELIGKGYSEFSGSIVQRIHNVVLAAAKFNGVLVPPGETFSFNQTVGDISAATGYQPAYVIKEGRTVLGDGGGVCQVSSTLFRAALDAGLPIVERHAHAYRVHYYEEGGFKPGLDATVFAPTVDLKFKNDTPAYILIQTKPDANNLTLTFELYGTRDGRKAQLYNHIVWGEAPPPPPLYQDDPTLAPGVTKQVDFAAWGANASFGYRVTRAGQTLIDTKFVSNFRPWQAVYLRGPTNQ